jgi:group I intron endonuclease
MINDSIKNISGIYKITSLSTGRLYIGSSCRIKLRMKAHYRELMRGTHQNRFLQRCFDKHGSSNFRFEIIKECKKEDLLKFEQKYLDLYFKENPDDIYNIVKLVWDNINNCPINYGIASKGRYDNSDTKKKKSDASKRMWQNRLHQEHMSKIQSGSGNPFYGKKHSDESRVKITESRISRIPPVKATNQITGEIIFAKTNTELGKKLNVAKSTINERLNIKHKRFTESFISSVWKIEFQNYEDDLIVKNFIKNKKSPIDFSIGDGELASPSSY